MKRLSSIIIGIVFLIWFVGSIVAMFYCSRNNMYWLLITLFGQYFFVFGLFAVIAGIKDKNFQPMTLIFVLVGLGAMACGLILQFGTQAMGNLLVELTPYLLLSVFVVAGVCMALGGLLHYRKKMAVCTYAVNARVIDLRYHVNRGSTTYSCVYEYYYGGEYVKYASNVYSNVHVPQIGDYKELRINPSNPKEVWEGDTSKFLVIVLVMLGAVFALAGLGGMLAVYLQGGF